MKRTLILLLALLLCMSATGCFLSGIFGSTVAVSAGVDSSRSVDNGSKAYVLTEMDSEEYFKTERTAAERGTRRAQLTPERFILDIDKIVLYNNDGNGTYSTSALLELTMNPEGNIIPKHIDLAFADDFVRDASVFGTSFDGFSMQFLPHANSDSGDGYYVRSMVGIELPSEYDSVGMSGQVETMDGMPANLRFFEFDSLQPYDTGTGFLSYLTIGNDIETAGIQNPEGVSGEWDIPVSETSGNAVSLFFPLTEKIDFSPYENPEIAFNWDLENIVEIWDAGTPSDYNDDIITLSVTAPFPVSLTVRENETSDAALTTDSTAPSDVIAPAISGATSWNTLQWVNPIDEDFSKVVIIRKADSAPASSTDGDEVYSSYAPNYVDDTGVSGTHYYYKIFAVDYSGNYSDGLVLDQVQN